jgi:hypothetical protein
MDGEFFGLPRGALAESQSTAPMPMDISCSTASMDISSGLGFERPGAQTESEIEVSEKQHTSWKRFPFFPLF